jgi:hypothetical protein
LIAETFTLAGGENRQAGPAIHNPADNLLLARKKMVKAKGVMKCFIYVCFVFAHQ